MVLRRLSLREGENFGFRAEVRSARVGQHGPLPLLGSSVLPPPGLMRPPCRPWSPSFLFRRPFARLPRQDTTEVLGTRLTTQLINATKAYRPVEATPASELSYDGLLGGSSASAADDADALHAPMASGRGRHGCTEWRNVALPTPERAAVPRKKPAMTRREAKKAADVKWEA